MNQKNQKRRTGRRIHRPGNHPYLYSRRGYLAKYAGNEQDWEEINESDHTWSTSNRSEESDSESEELEQEPGRDDTPETLRGRNKENEGQRQQQQIVDILNTQPWEEEFLQNGLNATRDETAAARELIPRPPELEIERRAYTWRSLTGTLRSHSRPKPQHPEDGK